MTASDLSFECVCGSEIIRHGSLGEPVDTELLVAESEADPGNLPTALCPLLLPDRVDNTQG